MLQITLENNLSRLWVSSVNLSITPARDQLGHPVIIDIKRINIHGSVLTLNSPRPNALAIHTHRPIRQRIAELCATQLAQRNDTLRLGHLIDDFIVLENADIEVLWADRELIEPVGIEVEQRQRAHIVTSDCPQHLLSHPIVKFIKVEMLSLLFKTLFNI